MTFENEKRFKGSWDFSAGPFARESERLKHYFIFSVRRARFRIPPTMGLARKFAMLSGKMTPLVEAIELHEEP
jgi:hypothetical protein